MKFILHFVLLCSLCKATSNGTSDDTIAVQHSYQSKEVVITGERARVDRGYSPAVVHVVSSQFFRMLGQPTLGTALCFIPGVRTEVNCQTCNYTQVRLNGLAGNYTQLLINGRPIVSPLLTLYGLDHLPTAMIDRVEVLRGSASALYGSAAIAGVVNLVTRTEWESSATVTAGANMIGGVAPEATASASVLLGANPLSMALTAHHRAQAGFDANGDGFTELAQLHSTSLGIDAVYRDSVQILQLHTAVITEERRGGNRLELPPDRAEQAEYRNHHILFTTVNYTKQYDLFHYDLYAALNATSRIHYTGVDYVDGWGRTRSMTGIVGVQARWALSRTILLNSVLLGTEYQFERTRDAVEAYGYAVDQEIKQGGMFVQASGNLVKQLFFTTGLRVALHNRIEGIRFLWRAGLLWRPTERWEFRVNYSDGLRAPQAFETDLHIAFASGGVSFVRIDPHLQMETAQSLSLSATHRLQYRAIFTEFSFDGFATVLYNPFVLSDGGIDALGNRILVRTNGSTAQVLGVSFEGQVLWNGLEINTTVTIQRAWYRQAMIWSLELPPERTFLRTPEVYGAIYATVPITNQLETILSGILTGPMLVPYMGVTGDRLVRSPVLLDGGMIVRWMLFNEPNSLGKATIGLKVSNIFNAYQRDFDQGKYRDSNYIWGPPRPRTVGIELQWGHK
ncbi:MAG: TonB-dependent receptor [Bacteroidota bacterium]|nr:TonB-dependent receptor [Bacteroidota bacterium]